MSRSSEESSGSLHGQEASCGANSEACQGGTARDMSSSNNVYKREVNSLGIELLMESLESGQNNPPRGKASSEGDGCPKDANTSWGLFREGSRFELAHLAAQSFLQFGGLRAPKRSLDEHVPKSPEPIIMPLS